MCGNYHLVLPTYRLLDALRAVPLPGDGLVGRWPGVLCVARSSDDMLLRRLVELCAEASAAPDLADGPGRLLARALAQWLGGPEGPGDRLTVGTLSVVGDRLAVFLAGRVGLRTPDHVLDGADAATWTDRLLTVDGTVELVLDGMTVPYDVEAGVADLRAGIVAGAGAVLLPTSQVAGGVPSRAKADLDDLLRRSRFDAGRGPLVRDRDAGQPDRGEPAGFWPARHLPVGSRNSGRGDRSAAGGGKPGVEDPPMEVEATPESRSASPLWVEPHPPPGSGPAASVSSMFDAPVRGHGRAAPDNGSIWLDDRPDDAGERPATNTDRWGVFPALNAPHADSAAADSDSADSDSAGSDSADPDSADPDTAGSPSADPDSAGSADAGPDSPRSDRPGADNRGPDEPGSGNPDHDNPDPVGTDQQSVDPYDADVESADDAGVPGRGATPHRHPLAGRPLGRRERGRWDAGPVGGHRHVGLDTSEDRWVGEAGAGARDARDEDTRSPAGRPAAATVGEEPHPNPDGDNHPPGQDRMERESPGPQHPSSSDAAADGAASAGAADGAPTSRGSDDSTRWDGEADPTGDAPAGGRPYPGSARRSTAGRSAAGITETGRQHWGSSVDGRPSTSDAGTPVWAAPALARLPQLVDRAPPERAPDGAGPRPGFWIRAGGSSAPASADREPLWPIRPGGEASGGGPRAEPVADEEALAAVTVLRPSRHGLRTVDPAFAERDAVAERDAADGSGDVADEAEAPDARADAVDRAAEGSAPETRVPDEGSSGSDTPTGSGAGLFGSGPAGREPADRIGGGPGAVPPVATNGADARHTTALPLAALQPSAIGSSGSTSRDETPAVGWTREDGLDPATGSVLPRRARSSLAARGLVLPSARSAPAVPRSPDGPDEAHSIDGARIGGAAFDGPSFDGPSFDGPGFDGPGFGGPSSDLAAPERASEDPGGRPLVGVLVFDDGVSVPVDAEYVVGRLPDADERVRSGALRSIALEDRSGAVSRVHAEVRLDGGDVLVVDSGSRNGTFVADPDEPEWTVLPARGARRLVPGTRVRMGDRTFEFRSSE